MASRLTNLEGRIKNLGISHQPVTPRGGGRGRRRGRGQRNNNYPNRNYVNNTTPAAFNRSMGRAPTQSARNGESIIEHTEYWFDAVSGASTSEDIITKTFGGDNFPNWLSSVAKNYERYDILNCSVHYRTSRGTNSGGVATLAVDWDPSAVAATTKNQVYVKNPIRRAPIWKDFDLHLQGNKLQAYKDMFVKPETATTSASTTVSVQRGSSAFQLVCYLSHDTVTAATRYGEVWISYRIRLKGAVMQDEGPPVPPVPPSNGWGGVFLPSFSIGGTYTVGSEPVTDGVPRTWPINVKYSAETSAGRVYINFPDVSKGHLELLAYTKGLLIQESALHWNPLEKATNFVFGLNFNNLFDLLKTSEGDTLRVNCSVSYISPEPKPSSTTIPLSAWTRHTHVNILKIGTLEATGGFQYTDFKAFNFERNHTGRVPTDLPEPRSNYYCDLASYSILLQRKGPISSGANGFSITSSIRFCNIDTEGIRTSNWEDYFNVKIITSYSVQPVGFMKDIMKRDAGGSISYLPDIPEDPDDLDDFYCI